MKSKLLGVIVLVLVLGLGGSYIAKTNGSPAPTTSPTATATASTTVSYLGVEGKNALELLKASHKVETKKYDFGELVQSIDGVASDSTKYWILYADGKMSEVGADALKTTTGQKLEWRLEAAQ